MPEHLAAALENDFRHIMLECVAKSIVGDNEEPGITAAIKHGLAGNVRERIGRVSPLNEIRRAEFSAEIGRPSRGGDEHLVPLTCKCLNGDTDGRHRHIENNIDTVLIVPLARNVGADVGLVLMVAENDLDWFPENVASEFLDGELRACDRTLARSIGKDPRHVGEYAELETLPGRCPQHGGRRKGCADSDHEMSSLHYVLPFPPGT